MYEFHISRASRNKYHFDQSIYQFNGNVILADFHAARLFAARMNAQRNLLRFPENAVQAGEINALGLIDEILHLAVAHYRKEHPEVMGKALHFLAQKLGENALDHSLESFCQEFPPAAVYRRELSVTEYLAGATHGLSHREVALEEILLNSLSNQNQAFQPFKELFDDTPLARGSVYRQILSGLDEFFRGQPPVSPQPGQAGGESLIDFLSAPARAAPHSLTGQLDFIRRNWSVLIGPQLYRLLSSLDLIQEETMMRSLQPGLVPVPDFNKLPIMEEPERFSPDTDWMPRLVMIAKNTYVWLDQLSKKYQRSISRLDQIPTEELDTLARWGFSGLWLIGLWERSPASARIKKLTGNPEAISSAYSLYDYTISQDLGGDEAYQALRERAAARGIRLAADMVPNHTGVYSKWVVEHPDWYIGLDQSPFPNYTFNGPDLSEDARTSIFIEDRYYDRSDAAVVFKHIDRPSGRTRYIYHGNDGTSMPWNDTAQLNYLMPQVREAVIQTILEVARKFSVIRFDAAMTLAKKHYQRLWFPEPGSGGAIPSRAGLGLTREQLDQAMPQEFWREVVDRVAQEVPGTLLLAEAFWLMEGYFVRTLGMHRVYNSAFMNMLRDEKNAEYRQVIKNTLEFDPEILKRYVNFMNNPDEDTAVAQFGKGGKYFGVCILMATMPGLPMFGHGQIEGLEEKYGMEYKRAYYAEQPDGDLVARHAREVFPLLQRRSLFAGVENFLLYDFFTPDGRVDENVFALSNREGQARGLVVYHNKWAETSGRIKTSVAFAKKRSGEKILLQHTLGEGLSLPTDGEHFVIFREQISGREYIRNCHEIHSQGLFVQLGAYEYQVFLDFRVVQDTQNREYASLADFLDGRGVPNLEEARQEILLRPVLGPFKKLVNAQIFREIQHGQINEVLSQIEPKVRALFLAVRSFTDGNGDLDAATREVCSRLETLLRLPKRYENTPAQKETSSHAISDILRTTLQEDLLGNRLGLAWVFTYGLGKMVSSEDFASFSRSWLDEWLLGKQIASAFQESGADQQSAWRALSLLKVTAALNGRWFALEAPEEERAIRSLHTWLQDQDARVYLGINRFQGVLWYNKEALQGLINWLLTVSMLEYASQEQDSRPQKWLEKILEVAAQIRDADQIAGYQVEALLDALKI